MSIIGYTKATPTKVWLTWSNAHQGNLVTGATGISQKISYTILDVVPGKKFSVSWKALFVRLIFSHEVLNTSKGTEIRYDFKLTGPFAWIVRWWVAPKIRANLYLVLEAFIKQLDQ